MRKYLFTIIISLFLGTSTGFGQTFQKGTVNLFNSGKTPLPGTGILAVGAPATDTDLSGNFTLTLPKSTQGQGLIVSEIYKKGYELVNDAIMYSWILSEKKPMRIIMAPEGMINESKERLYNVCIQNETKRFQKKIEELNTLFQQDKLTEEEREQEIAALRGEITRRREIVKRYSDVFARINPDDVDIVEKNVLQQIREGKMEEAIQTYHNSQILQKAMSQLEVSIKETEDILNMIPVLYRYASTCMLTGGEKNIRKALEIHQKIAEDNPSSFDYTYQYVQLLMELIHKDQEVWIDKCISLAMNDTQLAQALFLKVNISLLQNEPDKIYTSFSRLTDLLNEAGDLIPYYISYNYSLALNNLLPMLFSRNGALTKAIPMYQKQVEDIQNNQDITPELKKEYMKGLYGLLGNCYASLNNYDLARKYTQKGFDLCRQDEKDTTLLAEAKYEYYTFMATYYMAEEKFPPALEYCEKASPIAEFLIDKKPHRIHEYLQHFLIAGGIAQYKGDWEYSELEYLKAHELLEQKGKDMHELFISRFRLSLCNLITDLYNTQNKFDKASIWVKRTQEIAEIVETTDPLANAPLLVQAFFNSANFFYKQNNLKEAKLYYQKVLTIYEIIPESKALGEQSFISTLTNLGAIHMLEKNNKEAMRLLKQSYKILQKQLKENPESPTLLFSYANNITNQGCIEMEMKKSENAIKHLSEAESIYKMFLSSNEPQFSYYLIAAKMNLSIAYFMDNNMVKAEDMLNSCMERVTKMAASYPNIYEPTRIVVCLMKGEFYTKTNRKSEGKEYIAQALEQAQNYPDDPIVQMAISDYKQGGIYKTK